MGHLTNLTLFSETTGSQLSTIFICLPFWLHIANVLEDPLTVGKLCCFSP